MEETNDLLLADFVELQTKNNSLIKQGVNDYSLINSMLSINDEVHLHSKFIYSMINPHGLHYQNDLFLKKFLKLLPSPEFDDYINMDNIKVYREKGNIDLLIHNDEYYLIIENKLNAQDQAQQITRYIELVNRKFFKNSSIKNKVAVVYLSKSKSEPTKPSSEESKNNYSLVGFNLNKKLKQLEWKGEEINLNGRAFQLPKEIYIPYFYMNYGKKGIRQWVSESISECGKNNLINLKYAFEEYEKILMRFDKTQDWKKIMTLTTNTLNKFTDAEEQDVYSQQMYSFMSTAHKEIYQFIAEYLFTKISEIFSEEDKLLDPNIELQEFSVSNIKKWVAKKGTKNNYKNVGFSFINSKGKEVVFIMATSYAYLAEIEEGKIFDLKNRLIIEGGNLQNILLLNKSIHPQKTALQMLTLEVEKKYEAIK